MGIFGVVVQRLSKLADGHTQAAVEIYEGIVQPKAVSEFLPADDLSRFFKEDDKEPARLLLQADSSPVLQELPRVGVHLKGAELVRDCGFCLHVWGHLQRGTTGGDESITGAAGNGALPI